MNKRPHALQDLTWVEFAERLHTDRPVILLPLGSQEEQGPHAPMGDYVVAEQIALAAAERAKAICAPVLPFGYAEFFRGMAGGIQLRAETFSRVLEDMITSFLDHNIAHIVICNGHSTNAALIADVTHKVRRQHGVIVPNLNLWRLMPDNVWSHIHGANAPKVRGHGADPLTSVAMHLTPDLMRPDLLQMAERKTAFGLPITGQFSNLMFQGAAIDVPLDVTQVAPDGVGSGDARLSTATAGAAMTEWLTAYVADFLEHFKACDPRDPNGQNEPTKSGEDNG
jgi:creatinine amidohydrolase